MRAVMGQKYMYGGGSEIHVRNGKDRMNASVTTTISASEKGGKV